MGVRDGLKTVLVCFVGIPECNGHDDGVEKMYDEESDGKRDTGAFYEASVGVWKGVGLEDQKVGGDERHGQSEQQVHASAVFVPKSDKRIRQEGNYPVIGERSEDVSVPGVVDGAFDTSFRFLGTCAEITH